MVADVEHVDRSCMKLTADRATRRVIGTRASPDAAAAIQGRATVVGGPAHDRQARYDGWVEQGQTARFSLKLPRWKGWTTTSPNDGLVGRHAATAGLSMAGR
jgi:hypothetical protein